MVKRVFCIGFVFLAFCFALCFVSCQKEQARVENVIGTVCSVNAYEDGTKKLYDQLFARLREIDCEFSRTIEGSDVNRVNELAGVDYASVSRDVFFVAEKALWFAQISEGAFDPTVGPLVDLWAINSDSPRVPDQHELEAALSLVNYRNVFLRILDEGGDVVYENNGAGSFAPEKKSSYTYQIRLNEKNMKLELGGIAKGYAADQLALLLKANSVKRAVIDLGGNIYVFGKKPNGNWTVGIKNPFEGQSVAAALATEPDTSVVSSGVYERFFEQDGRRYHHIFDTVTGMPSEGGPNPVSSQPLWGTTVVCSSSLYADALSTIAFLLGPEKFIETAEANKAVLGEVKSLFISGDKKIALSHNLTESLSLLDETFTVVSLR